MGTYLKRWGPSFQRTDKLITPRLANARLADRVIVLEDGHGQASALPVVAAPVPDLETTNSPWQARVT